jgi:hypothetical protein
MSEKRFFEYSTPSLRAVHAFNTMVMTIHRQCNAYIPSYEAEAVRYAAPELREQVMELLLTPKNHDELSKFVPGSAKHQQILERVARYESAQGVLRDLGYQSEVVCDEIYPDYMRLVQHQVTVTEEEYDQYEDLAYQVQRHYSFLTRSKFGFGQDTEVLEPEKIQDLCLPYVTYKNGDKRDLIQESLDNTRFLNRRIHSMELAEKLEIKHWELAALLPLEELVHKSDALGLRKYVEYKGHEYSEFELLKLHKDWLAAKEQKWVKDDQYMSYPTWGTYVEFLERVKAGEFSPA